MINELIRKNIEKGMIFDNPGRDTSIVVNILILI